MSPSVRPARNRGMGIELEQLRVGDLHAVALSNDVMRLVVVPELGGKIISLTSRRSGREWLWSNPYLPLRKPPAGASDFGRYDTGGWDEVFPTINPCRVPNTAWGEHMLTDHGELWYRPWRTIAAALVPQEAATLTLAVDNVELPFRFERTLTLEAGIGPLIASYELTNRSDSPLPYLWAAHPLLAVEPGNTIRLPAGTRMTSTGGTGLEFAGNAALFAWPMARLASGQAIDFSRVPDRAAKFAMKFFATGMSPGRIELVDKDQHASLQLSLDGVEIPCCGLWLNYGGWSGAGTSPYFNVGIEPTSSPHDDLSVALRQQSARVLQESQTARWQLTILEGDRVN